MLVHKRRLVVYVRIYDFIDLCGQICVFYQWEKLPLHPQAAVHGEYLTGNGVGFVRQQEFHHFHNAVGVAEFGYRRFRNDFGTHGFWYFADHAFVHVPRRYAIHGYVIGGQFGGQGSGQAKQGAFRCGIGCRSRDSGLRHNR